MVGIITPPSTLCISYKFFDMQKANVATSPQEVILTRVGACTMFTAFFP